MTAGRWLALVVAALIADLALAVYFTLQGSSN